MCRTVHLHAMHHYFLYLLVLSGLIVSLRLAFALHRYREYYKAARQIQVRDPNREPTDRRPRSAPP